MAVHPSTPLPEELDVFTCPLDGMRLIEASAGTGKTWNICGLVMRLLLERRLPVQHILVVTFTNAATAELRERIRERIASTLAALRPPPGTPDAPPSADPFVQALLQSLRDRLGLADDAMVSALALALQTFDEAAIFTIHGFCQRALADTPFAAQMPLQQTLLHDDSDLLLQAVQDFWRQHVAGPAADPALTSWLLTRGDTPERWARLLKRQMAKPLSVLRWPEDIDAPALPGAGAGAVDHAFAQARMAWPTQGEAALEALRKGLGQLNGTTYKADGLAQVRQAWAGWMAAASPPGPHAALPPKAAQLGSAMLQAKTKAGKVTPEHPFFHTAQALLDALAARARHLALARLRLLRSLLADAGQALRDTKRQHRVVAFDDMLFNLHQRLQGPGGDGLAASLRARFPAALIDEFQDTDPLQFAVFHRIHGTPVGAGSPPLFLVGDPKQAIYSFRHADLHTYLQARSLAASTHTLLANQRATRPLISALNHLFTANPQAFMQPGLAYHPVAFGAKPRAVLSDATEPRAPLQLWSLPRDTRSGQPLNKAQAMAAAALACAGEITRLLTAAGQGQVRLGSAALRAGDIAVLVRSHSQGSTMRQALADLGVGSVELSQASIFRSPDAEELERVLTAVLSPARAGLVKAALATRAMGFNAPQIDAWAQDEPGQQDLLLRLAGYQRAWLQQGVGFMLRQWLHAEAVPQRLLAQPDGARRLTNLLHLTECLHQAAAEHPSPEALLRWLQTQREDGRGDETTQLRLESDRNLVQIITIHKSKGLEYPVVFCPFLWDGRLRANGDGLEGLDGHDGGQAVVDFRAGLDPAFDETAAKDAARHEAAAETLRLVYVALTRAVQRCYLVTGSYRVKSGKHYNTAESGRSLLNWLVAGSGQSAEDWLKTRRTSKQPVAEPEDIAAAWAALAAAPVAEAPAAPGAQLPPQEGSALSLTPLPPPWRQALPPADRDAPPAQALPAPRHLGLTWRIGSYSGLSRHEPASTGAVSLAVAQAVAERLAADHDDQAVAPPADDEGIDMAEVPHTRADTLAATAAPDPDSAEDVLGFPRGAAAGECVHAAFEWSDFTQPATWPDAISRALLKYPPTGGAGADALAQAAWPAMLQNLLRDVLNTPLPVGTAQPLCLATLPPERRLNELEFHLPATQLVASQLNQTLRSLGYRHSALDFATLRGYLKGYIDLVFEHEGRYFIADWKSNHLGNTPSSYGPDALEAAMASHRYTLQHLVYGVALHRWLTRRLPHYRYEQHFGGAVYLFVRGVRPGWRNADGSPAGLHFHRPSAATIQRLSALLGAEDSP